MGLWPVSYLRVVSTWFDRRLGLAIGIANGGIGLGAAILPPIITYVITNGSLQWAYVSLAVIVTVIVLPLNALFLHDAPTANAVRPAHDRAAASADFRRFVTTRSFVILATSFFLLGFVNTGLVTNQISLLIDGGATPQHAAVVQSVFGIAVLLGRFLTGVLLDYVSAKRLMSLVCLGGAVACVLYALGPKGYVAFGCAILIGMVNGAEFDVLSYLIKRYFGLPTFARLYGSIFAIFQFGAALGATLLPLSRAQFQSYGPGLMLYAAALAIGSILFLCLTGARAARGSGEEQVAMP
ncbi:MFS transporter [Rhizobium mongolense]|uniref:MFS transporter n=1 Tax=Rhizobium mongolense TaxID=57676 RepID=UPI0034A447DE